MSNLETKQREDRFTISLFGLSASLGLVLFSWSLFHWLTSVFVLLFLLPYLLVIVLLNWLFSRSFLRWCRIRTSRTGMLLHILLTFILIAAAPVYSQLYASRLASNLVSELELKVRLESQDVQLIGWPNQSIGWPIRNITAVYSLQEPVKEVKDRLRSRLQHSYDWRFSSPTNTSEFRASCSSTGWEKGYELLLLDDGTLQITLEYGYPDNCKLK